MKKLFLILILFACARSLSAQARLPIAAALNAADSGQCSIANACLTLQLEATDSSASIQLSGTFSGTAQFEASSNGGSSWSAMQGPTFAFGTAVSSATAAGGWTFNVASKTAIRVRISGYTSGTFNATINSSSASSGLSSYPLPQNLTPTNVPSFGGVPQVNGLATTVNVGTDFVTANATTLQTITGLSFILPASIQQTVPFTCNLLYSQATANVAVAFGIQSATIAPTNILAWGEEYTNVTVNTEGNLPALQTSTATAIVSATPSAITTVWPVNLSGFIENPSNASTNTINIMVSTATGTDAVTIKRGSYCRLY